MLKEPLCMFGFLETVLADLWQSNLVYGYGRFSYYLITGVIQLLSNFSERASSGGSLRLWQVLVYLQV